MTPTAGGAIVPVVPSPPPFRFCCEVDSLEPLAGRLRDHDGRTTAFAGWIEFAAALAAAAEGLAPSPSTTDLEEHDR